MKNDIIQDTNIAIPSITRAKESFLSDGYAFIPAKLYLTKFKSIFGANIKDLRQVLSFIISNTPFNKSNTMALQAVKYIHQNHLIYIINVSHFLSNST